MTKNPTPPNAKGSTNDVVWIVGIIAAIGLVSGLSKCSSSSTGATATEITSSNPAVRTLSAAGAEQKPPAVEPLSTEGASAGVAGMRKAIAAEGLTGAMIFSQNCYEGLSRRFSWRTLDVCGAADLQAVASVPEDEVAGLDKETAYFQSETAAGRYLGAATGAGITAEVADIRLAGMQSRVSPAATGTGMADAAGGGIEEPEEAASGNEMDGASNQDVGTIVPDAAVPIN